MEQYRPNIGEVPAEDARRDAIHIAVVPLVADAVLLPGGQFGLTKEGKATLVSVGSSYIGIVDPFRNDVVSVGDRFWGMLIPNTITNLRHVWEHPAFKVKSYQVGRMKE